MAVEKGYGVQECDATGDELLLKSRVPKISLLKHFLRCTYTATIFFSNSDYLFYSLEFMLKAYSMFAHQQYHCQLNQQKFEML
jgi:hypothetical protein